MTAATCYGAGADSVRLEGRRAVRLRVQDRGGRKDHGRSGRRFARLYAEAARNRRRGRGGRRGRGSWCPADGFLISCAHVIEGATRIEAKLGERRLPARVVDWDPEHDLALLKIDVERAADRAAGQSGSGRTGAGGPGRRLSVVECARRQHQSHPRFDRRLRRFALGPAGFKSMRRSIPATAAVRWSTSKGRWSQSPAPS